MHEQSAGIIIEGLPLNILSKKEYNYAKVKVTEHSFYYRNGICHGVCHGML